ncbi:Bbp16 family capsid cement protein [Candidatus Avelusimicrobium luingense]|uniref:Bbp16 family capsid cement protein n=1 Tax=Candidatus Avelusimicrobium luingense TaxID=3416211 RepID=UPI003D14DE5D
MLLDQNSVLSDKQAVTTTAASTNIVDLKSAGNFVPGGMFAVCRVDVNFATLTSLKIALETADNAEFSNAVELASGSFLAAALTADKQLMAVAVPVGVKRYLRAKYTVTGDAATAGKISFFLTDAVDMH